MQKFSEREFLHFLVVVVIIRYQFYCISIFQRILEAVGAYPDHPDSNDNLLRYGWCDKSHCCGACQGCWLRPLISGHNGDIHKVSSAVAGIFLYLYAASGVDTVHRRKMSCPSVVYCQSDFSASGLHKNSIDYFFRQASFDRDFLPTDRLPQTAR